MSVPRDLNHRVLALEIALRALVAGAEPCKRCREDECYTLSRTSLAAAKKALQRD